MATSRDFSSPTYDFMIGNGLNMPTPIVEASAHLLIRTAEELWYSGVLRDFVGDNPIMSGMENCQLKAALEAIAPERCAQLQRAKARSVLEVYGTLAPGDQTEVKIFLACADHNFVCEPVRGLLIDPQRQRTIAPRNGFRRILLIDVRWLPLSPRASSLQSQGAAATNRADLLTAPLTCA